ncbi:MAG: hypothetical protein Aurels2KO_24910 [Aureliella sp.]
MQVPKSLQTLWHPNQLSSHSEAESYYADYRPIVNAHACFSAAMLALRPFYGGFPLRSGGSRAGYPSLVPRLLGLRTTTLGSRTALQGGGGVTHGYANQRQPARLKRAVD